MSDRLTMLDFAKQQDPKGKVVRPIEVLTEHAPMLQDAPTYPSNAPAHNTVVIRSSLPTVGFGKINKGTPRSKGTFRQVTDSMGIIDGRSEVDVKTKIVVGEANLAMARQNQDLGFVEAIAQLEQLTFLYGDEQVEENAFTGFMPRLAALASASTGSQVHAGGSESGQTDNTSILVVDWGERACHLIHPPGTTAGVEVRQLGEQSVNDADGNPMQAYVTAYLVSLGLSVEDPRHVGRLANIDVSLLANAGESGYAGADLIMRLIDLLAAMPDPGGNQRVIYCSNTVWGAFHKLAISKSNAALTMHDYLKRGLTPHFWEYPIRRIDRFSHAETRLT